MPAFLIHPSASASISSARTALDDACQQSRKRAVTAKYVLTPYRPTRRLPAETVTRSTITQIYEGTNQIQRVVMARHLLKG